jgi:mannose-6-phosphate isomerase-like protein (cupin superfamily)
MTETRYIPANAGAPFEDAPDRGRVLAFGRDTGGRYGLMEYVVAARPPLASGETPAYGAHRHAAIEETFLVRQGRLSFLLEERVIELATGDFVRVPPGTRHGFANLSGQPVELLVSFTPGGFEELFVRHRTDQSPPPRPNGFVEDATAEFGSQFEA